MWELGIADGVVGMAAGISAMGEVDWKYLSVVQSVVLVGFLLGFQQWEIDFVQQDMLFGLLLGFQQWEIDFVQQEMLFGLLLGCQQLEFVAWKLVAGIVLESTGSQLLTLDEFEDELWNQNLVSCDCWSQIVVFHIQVENHGGNKTYPCNALVFGHEYSEGEAGSDEDLKVIKDDDGKEMRKRKRMESNRESVRRSRQRKQKQLEELMGEVGKLRKENNQIMTTTSITSQHLMTLEAHNSVLQAQMVELNHTLHSLNDKIMC
ncbi:hypothetical protein G4B88_002237 [Cannabis sativa]|uniref:BZIP domain-containing protein n=1 Tax=Cannabis sativa TaxID=3483 RepID=A0A7J6FSP6_CANSA|nr:hypothetical protein G4B88_002237 [Cannabis sativa]